MGCIPSKSKRKRRASVGILSPPFLHHKLLMSSSAVDSGIINKEDFQLALLGSSKKKNLFLDRVFAMFDVNENGAIEFGEFVRSMSIFHPKASKAAKIQFMFNLYDIRSTGYIERDELKEMLLAILGELDLVLSDESVEAMLDKTLTEVDSKGDGKIDPEEWEGFVIRNPYLINNMTLHFLKELSITFPSFIMNSQVEDSDLSEGAHQNTHDNRFNCHRVVPSKYYGETARELNVNLHKPRPMNL